MNSTTMKGTRIGLCCLRLGALLGLALSLFTCSAQSAPNVAEGGTPFIALHIYYISPTGNDGYSGTSPLRPWATPNHSVVCGDVIIAAAGSYNLNQFFSGKWGAVSNCPSTSGGIDGAGGVEFAVLLCAGPNLGDCNVNGGALEAFRPDVGHWAIEGFNGTQATNAGGGCFSAENDNHAVQRYVAFVNDIASTCDLAGFDASGGSNGGSFDYIAAVGVVSFNGANSISPYCGSGISLAPGSGDAGIGTHIFIDGYFGAYNTNSGGAGQCAVSGNPNFPHSDGEGIIFDSYGGGYTVGGFTKQVVLENAVIWRSGNACVEVFPAAKPGTDLAQYVIFNITCYSNNQDPLAFCAGAELLLNGIYPSGTGSYNITNSIFESTQLTCGGAARATLFGRALALATGGSSGANSVYGALISETNSSPGFPIVTVQGNYIWQSHPPTTTTVGPPNTLVYLNGVRNSPWNFGTDTYRAAGLTNPSSLFSSSPDCSSYNNVTDCMLTAYRVYANVKPTLAPTTIGYQRPEACATDAYYPDWLKGIVYLHWNRSVITENPGLVTKPCGM
jgi:hypothetical protein